MVALVQVAQRLARILQLAARFEQPLANRGFRVARPRRQVGRQRQPARFLRVQLLLERSHLVRQTDGQQEAVRRYRHPLRNHRARHRIRPLARAEQEQRALQHRARVRELREVRQRFRITQHFE